MIKRNIIIWFLETILASLVTGLMLWLLPLLLARYSLGALSIVYAVSNALNVILPIIGGNMSEIFGRKPIMILGSTIVTLSLFMMYISQKTSGILSLILFLVGAILFLSGGSISRPASGALYMESCDQSKLGRIYSWIELVYTLSLSLGAFLLGSIIYLFSLDTCLLLSTLLMFSLPLLRIFVIETHKPKFSQKRSFLMRITSKFRALFTELRDWNIKLYTMTLVLSSLVGWGNLILPIFLNEDIHLTEKEVSIFYAISILYQGLLAPLGGKFVDKYGFRKALVLSSIIDSVCIGLFVLTIKVNPLLGISFLLFSGATTWFEGPAYFVIQERITRGKHRGAIFGAWNTISGVMGIFPPILVVFIWNIDHLLPFIITTIVGVIINLTLILGIKELNP